MKLSLTSFRLLVPKLCSAALLISLSAVPKLVPAETQTPRPPINEAPPSQTLEKEVVNINAATPATLAIELKGIGPSKASAIVQYWEKHGAFETADALVNVRGIGVKTVEKLRLQLVAGPYKTPQKGESLVEQKAAARAAVQSVVQRSL